MRFHFFTIEALHPAAGEEALNAFCAEQRVVSVGRHFVDQGACSYWGLCVATLDQMTFLSAASRRQQANALWQAGKRTAESLPKRRLHGID